MPVDVTVSVDVQQGVACANSLGRLNVLSLGGGLGQGLTFLPSGSLVLPCGDPGLWAVDPGEAVELLKRFSNRRAHLVLSVRRVVTRTQAQTYRQTDLLKLVGCVRCQCG